MSGPCAIPGCPTPAPGRFNDFCFEHSFRLGQYAVMVRKLRIERHNASDESTVTYLDDQIESYRRLAISKVSERGAA